MKPENSYKSKEKVGVYLQRLWTSIFFYLRVDVGEDGGGEEVKGNEPKLRVIREGEAEKYMSMMGGGQV